MFLRSREKSKLILYKIFHLIRSWEKFSIRIFKHCVAYCKQSLNVYWIKNIQSPNVKSQTIFPNNSIIISLIFNISDWYNWKIQSKIVCGQSSALPFIHKQGILRTVTAKWEWQYTCVQLRQLFRPN